MAEVYISARIWRRPRDFIRHRTHRPPSLTRLLSAFLKARGGIANHLGRGGFTVTLPNGSIRREIPLFGAINTNNTWPVLPGPAPPSIAKST